MFVCCECCMLSGRSKSLRRAGHSSRGVLPNLVRRCVCDLETSWKRRPWPIGGCRAKNKPTNKQTNATFQWTKGIFRKLAGVWDETQSHQPHKLQLSCFVYRISARTLSALERYPWFFPVSSHKCRLNLKHLRCSTELLKVHQWQIIKVWEETEAIIWYEITGYYATKEENLLKCKQNLTIITFH